MRFRLRWTNAIIGSIKKSSDLELTMIEKILGIGE